jgi:hypothetical protein
VAGADCVAGAVPGRTVPPPAQPDSSTNAQSDVAVRRVNSKLLERRGYLGVALACEPSVGSVTFENTILIQKQARLAVYPVNIA